MYILYFIQFIASCLCRSVIAHPYIYMYILIPFLYLDVCVLGSCCGIVRLHFGYYCIDNAAHANHVYVTNKIRFNNLRFKTEG
jgi:hypothetical protein